MLCPHGIAIITNTVRRSGTTHVFPETFIISSISHWAESVEAYTMVIRQAKNGRKKNIDIYASASLTLAPPANMRHASKGYDPSAAMTTCCSL
jgi:hypothetical protein